MDFRNYGFFDNALLSALHDMIELSDDVNGSARSDKNQGQNNQNGHQNPASRAYMMDARAMARTPADVKEYPNAYQFTVDMPGVGPSEVKVQLDENDGVLVVSGERGREKENQEGVNYLRMERRMGKFMRKFALPENVNREAISAVCRDGVLTVTVEKLPPPEPKKPKTIEVKVA